MSKELENRTLTLTRTFNAPIKLVWEAWTKPEHIAHWWGPKGMKVNIIEHNFELGGQWRYSMTMPNGAEFITEGIYSLIEELKRIHSSADFKPMTEGVELQSIFEEAGDKTNFTFHVIHETEEYCKQQEEMGFYKGWGSVFDNLSEYLKEKV
ncbi:MAG: SRPBCC domain-containing protein [Bacteroidia bacterium]|nr:SRPBCC domain-containing protein [Bacteroidia bacterium]